MVIRVNPAIFIAACCSPASPVAKQHTASLVSVVPECVTAESLGALPDDGADDRIALQTGLAQSGCIQLAAGTYDIGMNSPGANGRRDAAILSPVAGVHLRGVGDATVFKFAGDALGQDWTGIAIVADNIELDHVTLDTSALVGTTEHTAAVRGGAANSGVNHVRIHDVTFNHPQRGLPGGDCIQFACYEPDRVCTDILIRDNDFAHCDRSGAALHSGVHALALTDNMFGDTGDQDLDAEGTGGNRDWLIARNTFNVGPHPQGSLSWDLQLVDGLVAYNNEINGRGVFAYSCRNCSFISNRITRTAVAGAQATFEAIEDSDNLLLSGNTITRSAGVDAGNVIHLGPHTAVAPHGAVLERNIIVQATGANPIATSGVIGLTLAGNTIQYTATATGMRGLQANGAVGIRTDQLSVVDNSFTGPLLACVGVSGSYGGTASVTLQRNSSSGATSGLRCENVTSGSGVSGPVIASQNTWAANVCGNPSIVVP